MPNQFDVDPARDAEIAALAKAVGSINEAARQLGIGRRGAQGAVQRHNMRQAEIVTGPAQEGSYPYVMKGVSTYLDAEGNIKGQWVKTKIDDELRAEALKKAVEALAKDIPPAPLVPPPALSTADLLNLFVFTDYHLGMLADKKEGGADWDLKIAERLLKRAFDGMMAAAPDAETCIVYQGGDFFHYDSFKPVTPASGHILDADSRFFKMVEVGVRVLRHIVHRALEKHATVHVIMGEGNHDEASSVWLRVMFAALFEGNPRVTVEQSPLPYYAYQHGDVMLAFHHGHKLKVEQLGAFIAAQFREMWGATKKAYGHSGHYHHELTKGLSGIKWTQHPTLAAADAHSARTGYVSERETSMIVYHKKYGRVQTNSVCPEMYSE